MKISDMTEEDAVEYIDSKLTQTKLYLGNLDCYYNNKLQAYIETKDKSRTLYELKECAYACTDTFERIEWALKKQLIEDMATHPKNIKPKRGEIWTCQLGKNIGSEEHKTRPVIIIQNNTGNEKSPTTLIVPISKKPKKIATHIVIRESDYSLADGETQGVQGTILCEQIRVFSKTRLGRCIATFTDEFMERILASKLKMSIGL